MLPLEFIREHADEVRRAAGLKGEGAPVDEILRVDREWREATARAETLRAEQKALQGPQADRERLKQLSQEAKERFAQADELRRQLDELLLQVPNLFDPSVPVGEDENDNVAIREWGSKPEFAFEPRTHYDLGETLGIMDFEHAAKVAGSRFGSLSGLGAKLQRALVQWMLDVHTREHGYRELYVPFLVNSEAMYGTANLPKFGGDSFRLADRDLWLIPTAEVPVTNWHRDEILEAGALPVKYVAHTPCWRSEAGAAGKDTRGYIRMHQFEKVELVKLTAVESSLDELEALTRDAEDILQRLGIHYRVLLMCSGDMGFAQYKKYDLEAWCPGLGRFLEVSSCSLFRDFQARRANIRYRSEPKAPPKFVHTLNGSGLALARTLDAILENYQQPDGSVLVPEALQPYVGVDRIA